MALPAAPNHECERVRIDACQYLGTHPSPHLMHAALALMKGNSLLNLTAPRCSSLALGLGARAVLVGIEACTLRLVSGHACADVHAEVLFAKMRPGQSTTRHPSGAASVPVKLRAAFRVAMQGTRRAAMIEVAAPLAPSEPATRPKYYYPSGMHGQAAD